MKWTPALPKKDLKLYFTKGKELMTPDLKEYIGTYYKKRDNFFTYIDEGKGPKTLLVKLITDSDWRVSATVGGTSPSYSVAVAIAIATKI